MKDEFIEAFAQDGPGEYCCAICLTWYQTREEKNTCMTDRHGYELLNVTMRAGNA